MNLYFRATKKSVLIFYVGNNLGAGAGGVMWNGGLGVMKRAEGRGGVVRVRCICVCLR